MIIDFFRLYRCTKSKRTYYVYWFFRHVWILAEKIVYHVYRWRNKIAVALQIFEIREFLRNITKKCYLINVSSLTWSSKFGKVSRKYVMRIYYKNRNKRPQSLASPNEKSWYGGQDRILWVGNIKVKRFIFCSLRKVIGKVKLRRNL